MGEQLFVEQTLEQIKEYLLAGLKGLTEAEARWQPKPDANPIAFIVWHVARVEDNWVQRFAQKLPEAWESEGWFQRLNLPKRDSGFGYTAEQVRALALPPMSDLLAYYESVRKLSLAYLRGLTPEQWEVKPWPDRRPDYDIRRMWRQLVCEEAEHAGQVAYLRGLQRGLDK